MTKGKFGGALAKLQQANTPPATSEPENLISGNQESPKSGKPEVQQIAPAAPTREKYSTILDSDLVQQLKLYAVKHRLKDREVVEAALRAYLPQE